MFKLNKKYQINNLSLNNILNNNKQKINHKDHHKKTFQF
jgi:hypothetical protein